jgi:hypothetical protein
VSFLIFLLHGCYCSVFHIEFYSLLNLDVRCQQKCQRSTHRLNTFVVKLSSFVRSSLFCHFSLLHVLLTSSLLGPSLFSCSNKLSKKILQAMLSLICSNNFGKLKVKKNSGIIVEFSMSVLISFHGLLNICFSNLLKTYISFWRNCWTSKSPK